MIYETCGCRHSYVHNNTSLAGRCDLLLISTHYSYDNININKISHSNLAAGANSPVRCYYATAKVEGATRWCHSQSLTFNAWQYVHPSLTHSVKLQKLNHNATSGCLIQLHMTKPDSSSKIFPLWPQLDWKLQHVLPFPSVQHRGWRFFFFFWCKSKVVS